MNDLLKLILLNRGKAAGIILGLTTAFFIIFFGILKTLFILGLIVLGFILGKWHDEGVSFKKFLLDMSRSLRENKWR